MSPYFKDRMPVLCFNVSVIYSKRIILSLYVKINAKSNYFSIFLGVWEEILKYTYRNNWKCYYQWFVMRF